jgi:S-formylglutathione hydrolase FrmB
MREKRLSRAISTLRSCLLFSPLVYAQQEEGRIVEETFQSDALKGNLLNDATERQLYVYLPPGYQKSRARRYPVVYLLHGYGSSYRQWMAGGEKWNIRDVIDRSIKGGKVRAMIVVMPDGSNKYGGSFYTNSVTNGNWEDYLTKDLTAFIDEKYRTLRQSASRGIAGHSMGGYGAIKTGMKHPETYGAVYGLSACCLGWGSDLASGNPS